MEKIQDENKNLKLKTERLYRQLQRKKKKNSIISSRTTSLSSSSTLGSTSESSSFQNQGEETFGAKTVWNYFEARDGKGPCDGIGGTSK